MSGPKRRFVLLALWLLGVQMLAHAAAWQKDQAQTELEERLWKALKNATENTAMTSEAESACRKLVERGASKIKHDTKFGDDTKNEKAGERAARTFGAELLKKTEFDERTGRRTINIASFRAASEGVCPLYPFC